MDHEQFSGHGSRKVSVRLDERSQRQFAELAKYLSPVKPELMPVTEVLLYCIDETWKANCGKK